MRSHDPRAAGLLAGLLAFAPVAGAADLPALPPAPVPTTGGPVVVTAGCPNCGPAAAAAHPPAGPVRAAHGGVSSPVGCTDCLAEKTFLLGSSGQFFHPQYEGVCGAGGHAGKHGHGLLHNPFPPLFGRFRPAMVYGPGGLGDHNMCQYGSYLNR